MNLASRGGLIRDEFGNWIKCFFRNIGTASAAEAKFWTLRDGLRLALELDLKRIQVETDAQIITIMQNSSQNHHLSNLISDCRYLMSQLEVVAVEHIYREANKCADIFANQGSVAMEGLHFCITFPSCTASQLYDDAGGMSYPRTWFYLIYDRLRTKNKENNLNLDIIL